MPCPLRRRNRGRDGRVHSALGLGLVLGLGQIRGGLGLVLAPRLNLGQSLSVNVALGLVDGVGRDVRGQGQVLVAGRRVPQFSRLLPPRSVGRWTK